MSAGRYPMESDLCSVLIKILSPHCSVYVEAFQRGGASCLFLTWCQATGEERDTPTEAIVVEGRRDDLDGEYSHIYSG
jgi:hypothetical protein